MAINTNRIIARLEKSKTALTLLQQAVKSALGTYKTLDDAYLAIETNPPAPLPEGADDKQIESHQTEVGVYQTKLRNAAEAAKAAFDALRDTEVANNRRIEALETIIAQQTAALERKAAVYPKLLKSHLRRRANAGERTAKVGA